MTDHTHPRVISTKLDQDNINNMPERGDHVVTFLTMEDLENGTEQIRQQNRSARLNSIEAPFKPASLELL